MNYIAKNSRYENMIYRRCGKTGLKLPVVSLGLWHNFGGNDVFEMGRELVRGAFDLGITHFDLANNYGPPAGTAEESFGKILNKDFKLYRDELIISTKAGYKMWQGPYGDWGSRKYLISSLDQSLKRMGLDYVDIFYHHRPDPETPLEETMLALDQIVRQGKSLYVGLSNYYDGETLHRAIKILKELKTPMVIHQVRYNMFDRRIEDSAMKISEDEGIGNITFSPLEQGILTDRYLNGIPKDSRAAKSSRFLTEEKITEDKISKVIKLKKIAARRGQTMAQLALAWQLRDSRITSVLIGASKYEQIKENIDTIKNISFTCEEIKEIEAILA